MYMIADNWGDSVISVIVTIISVGIVVAFVFMVDMFVWYIKAYRDVSNQKALALTKYIKLHHGILPTLGLASRIAVKLDNFVDVRYKIKLFTTDDDTGLFGNADDFEHTLAAIIEDWIMEDLNE